MTHRLLELLLVVTTSVLLSASDGRTAPALDVSGVPVNFRFNLQPAP